MKSSGIRGMDPIPLEDLRSTTAAQGADRIVLATLISAEAPVLAMQPGLHQVGKIPARHITFSRHNEIFDIYNFHADEISYRGDFWS